MPSFKSNIRKIYLFKFFICLHFIGGVLIPFFTDWGGISFTQIMILQSFFMFSVFILEVPTGAVADCWGRKQSIILGAAFGVLAPLVYTSMPNFYIFLLGEFIWALSVALLSGADEALIYDTLKKIKESERSKKIFARIESFRLAAIMISAPIGSLIAIKFGLRAPMMLIALPVAISAIIALTFKEPKTARKVESMRYMNVLKDGVKFFYKNKILKVLALDMIFIGSIAYFMIWFYQPMLKQAGVNIAYFGFICAAFIGVQIIIMNNYAWLEKIFGSKKSLIFISAVITGLMFIIGGLTKFLPLVLMVILLGGGFGLSRRPLFASYMNKYIPSSKRATVLSSVSMVQKFVLMVVNPIVGFMVDWSLSYALIFLGLLAVGFSLVSRVEEGHLID